MASLGDIVIGLRMDAGQFGAGARRARNSLADIATSAKGVALELVGMLGATTAAGAIGLGVKLAADAEQSQIAFEVMLGSAASAKKMLSELRAFSDRSPFGSVVPREAAQTLLNFGVGADQILPTIRMLGDVAAGDGQKLKGLALVFGQMSATGRLMGQDLLQFINAGFNPLQQIAARTGESMATLKKRMEAGGISAQEVRQAFLDATSAGGRFHGMTERQASSLAGLWSTAKDTVVSALTDLGQQIIQTLDLKRLLQNSIQWLQMASNFVKAYGSQIVTLASIVGGALVAAMTAYSAVQTVVIAKLVATHALSGPRGWIVLAAGLTAAAVATGQIISGFNNLEVAATDAAAAAEKVTSATAGSATEFAKIADVQKRIRELNQSAMPNVARAVAKKELAAADPMALLGIKTVGAESDAAADRVKMLRAALVGFVTDVGRLNPDIAAGYTDLIKAEIDSTIGLTAAIEKEQAAIRKLKEEANPNAQREAFAAKGGSAEGLAQFDSKKNERSVLETLAKQMAELQKLKREVNPNAERDELLAAKISAEDLARYDTMKLQTEELIKQKKAAEDLAAETKKAQEQLEARAERLKESTLTDAQKKVKELREIEELFIKGMIDEQTRDKAVAQLDKGKSGEASKALLAGSSDAAAALLRGKFGTKSLESIAADSLKVQQKQLKLAEAEAERPPEISPWEIKVVNF